MAQRGQWILVLVIVGVLAGALIGGIALSPALAPVTLGSKAPDFRALDGQSRDSIDFASHRGDVVLLNVWATWCIPCEAEMPSIQRLYDEFEPQGLKVIAVSVDDGSLDRVMQWVKDRQLTFDIWHDQSGRIERVYQTTGVPETFVIDRDGVIVKKVIGTTEWDHPTQKVLFRELLADRNRE